MYMHHKGRGIGHCAIQVHGNDGNMASTLEMDMEVDQEDNEAKDDPDEDGVKFDDSDEESDSDLDGNIDVEDSDNKDGLKDITMANKIGIFYRAPS